jgi:putative hydrolase
MDAVDALTEIAFWLEREQAKTYRVEAFRKAAAAIEHLDADELAAQVRDGRLKRVKGIGDRTFGVVRQAVGGEVPDYLVELRAAGAAPLAEGGAELRALLRGDLHSHSDWSDGGSSIQEMARAARWRGREYQVLTDHSPRLTIANGLTAERLAEQLGVVAAVGAAHDGLPRPTTTSACSAGSRSTSSTTGRSTRPTRCSSGSTSSWPASTPSSGWMRAP